MSGNPIPAFRREEVNERDLGRCVRCGGQATEHHHRRRRREQDVHTHEPCNVVSLCRTCHVWAHNNPDAAKAMGWIVRPWDSPPGQPVHTWQYGWALLTCSGNVVLLSECEGCGEQRMTKGGMCASCLREEVCCPNPGTAAAKLCDCGGAAAQQLRQLTERMEEEGIGR